MLTKSIGRGDQSDFKERRAAGKTLVGLQVDSSVKDLKTRSWGCRKRFEFEEIQKFG